MANEELKKISKDLKSKDKNTVVKAIAEFRKIGNNTLIIELVELFEKSNDSEIKKLISNVLCDLQNQDTAETLINLLNTFGNSETRKMMLSACWQCRLDFTGYLEVFIDIVHKEEFELAFEAFTVIENIEVKLEAERKTDLIEYTKSAKHQVPEKNKVLVNEIIPIIENYETL